MGRGNIYFITKSKDTNVGFDAEFYYEKLDSLSIDYVENQTKEESEVPLESLQKLMQDLGAVTDRSYEKEEFAFCFQFGNVLQAKQKYFKPKLDQLKKQVDSLILSNVIKSAPALDFILDNEYGDLVNYDDGENEYDVSLDDFIRKLEPDVIYYVYENVILMH